MASVGQVTIDVSANTAKLQGGMTKAQNQMQYTINKMKKSLGVLSGALAAVGGISGFGAMIKSQIDAADKTAKLASKLSMTTESLSSLQYAAKFSGVEIGGLDSAISAMTRRLNNFARTGGGAAKTALEELGFTQEQIKSFKTADESFIAIAEKLSKLEPGMQKTAIAQDIFSKSAASIIPLLDQGKEGIEKFRAEAAKLGVVVNSDFADMSEQLNDNMDVLKSVFDGATKSMAEKFTPTLLKATRSLQDFLDVQYDLSKIETKNRIKEIGEELEELRKRAKSQPLIAASFYAEMSTLSTELSNLKADLEDINKKENMPTVSIVKNIKTKETSEVLGLKTDYSSDYISRLKANKDFLDKQRQASEEFNEQMTYSLAEPYEKLMITRDNQLAEFGNNAESRLLIEQNYAKSLEQLNKSTVKSYETAEKQKTKAAELETKLRLKSKEEEEKANRTWSDGAKDSLASYLESAKDTYQQANQVATSALYGMEDAMANFVKTGKLDFSSLADSIISDLVRIETRKAIAGIASSSIFGTISSLFTGTNSKGGVFSGGNKTQFAKGGLPFGSNLQFAMAGGGVGSMNEQGQEAIMPLTRGLGGELGVKAIGGASSSGNTIINISNESGTAIDLQQISESFTNDGDKQLTFLMTALERNPDVRNSIKGIK